MVILESLTGSGVCVTERKVCRDWCFPAASAVVVATGVCFRRPQICFSPGISESWSCGSSPLACLFLGYQSKRELRREWDRQSSNLLIYASRYRDQKTTLQINKASTWAEPLLLGGAGGECAVMSKLPLLHQPVGQVLGSCKQTLWSSSLEFISAVPYSYSISAIRPRV